MNKARKAAWKWATDNMLDPYTMGRAYGEGYEEGYKEAVKNTCEWLMEQEEMVGVSFHEDFIERFENAILMDNDK